MNPGDMLVHYEILEKAGVGGMGEVYRAKDTRLDRTVAIKIMSETMAMNEDLRSRFQREAKAISSLNHPNICTLFDVGHEDDTDFLVMEYIEGESLAERLTQGPLATADLLSIAIQVADGLDAAHRQGLIHRDLKPGNIMLTRSGAKILDFGLAKISAPGINNASSATMATIPMTAPLTMDGTILGTIQYMAPEALEGNEADARSDIFAFGALLYELATGQKAFAGKSQASLIASILKEKPAPVSQIQPLAPPMLEQVIDQCLAKDPTDRWQTAGDLKRALQWIVDGGSQAGVPVKVSKRRKTREIVLMGVVAVFALIALGLGASVWQLNQREERVVRSNVQLAEGTELWGLAGGMAEISPDGLKLAYVARDSTSDEPQIWVRSLDQLEGLPLPGTNGATFPFWSPDSRYIAYFADGKLKKVLSTGGPSLTLCEAANGRGGTWSAEDIILFTPTQTDVIHRVAAAGGDPMVVTVRDTLRGDFTHRWVHFLPDGRQFLFHLRTNSDAGGEKDAVCLGSLDSPETSVIVRARSNAVYADGQLFFMREQTLMALPFDPDQGMATGDAVPFAEGVSTMNNWSRGVFSVAPGGLLVYRAGQVAAGSQLEIMGLDGSPHDRIGPPTTQYSPQVSPDGTRLAVEIEDVSGSSLDIWLWDLNRKIRTRLTFDTGVDRSPLWSPDGSEVAFYSNRASGHGIYARSTDGTGNARLIAAISEGRIFPSDWSPDGSTIAFTWVNGGDGSIWTVLADGSEPPQPFLDSPFTDWGARFSPDGRWVALSSEESGLEEVYVTSYPVPGSKWQISTGEGDRPRWGPDGTKLYYLDNDDHLNVAEIDGTGEAFKVGKVRQMHELNPSRPGSIFDLFPDGERMVINHRLGVSALTRLVLVQNWPQEMP